MQTLLQRHWRTSSSIASRTTSSTRRFWRNLQVSYLRSDGAILSVPEPLDTANATDGGVDPNEFKNLVQTVQDLAVRVQALEK